MKPLWLISTAFWPRKISVLFMQGADVLAALASEAASEWSVVRATERAGKLKVCEIGSAMDMMVKPVWASLIE